MKKPKLKEPYEIKMKFPSKDHALKFFYWLCNSGEQNFWSIGEVDPDQAENLVAFHYWGDDGRFLSNQEVVCSPWKEWEDE